MRDGKSFVTPGTTDAVTRAGKQVKRGKPRWALALFVSCLLLPALGCVTIAEHRKLERRVIDLQRERSSGGARERLADLATEIDDLEQQIRHLEGRLDEVERTAEEARTDARKARREAAAAAVSGGRASEWGPSGATEAGASAAGVAGAGGPGVVSRTADDADLSDELKAYQTGLASWRERDYSRCIDQFGSFLQTYASSSRADDAAFWIADCHYRQGEFKNAVLRFDDVVRNYPTGNRAPDALYRQGESLLKLGPGFHEAAKRAFERVLKEYPDSARAVEAEEQLRLQVSG